VSDLGDAFRDMASEGPEDEGLLAAVHTASARAAVRRRVLLSSATAVAVLAAGAIAVTARDAPTSNDLVLGGPASPRTAPEVTPDPTPASEPRTDATATGPAAVGRVPSGTYGGRAVSPAGEPIEGLYVYVIPELEEGWTSTAPAARTDEEGRFDIPCPDGSVLLNAWELGEAQDGSTPNWRTTVTTGGYRLEDMRPPACSSTRQDTTVPEGAALTGTLRGPCGLALREVRAVFRDDYAGDHMPGHVVRDLGSVVTTTAADGAFRLAGLPPGGYDVTTSPGGEAKLVVARGPGQYEVLLDLTSDDCASPPVETASPEPEVTPTTEPEPTPEPSPSGSP